MGERPMYGRRGDERKSVVLHVGFGIVYLQRLVMPTKKARNSASFCIMNFWGRTIRLV